MAQPNIQWVFRTRRGEKSLTAKLTAEHVREIHRLYATGGWTQKTLAAKFDVSRGCISHILLGLNWPEIYAEFHPENQ